MFRQLLFGIAVLMLAVGCTISFQNIDTHGTATDLVDEDLATSPTISPDISVPVSLVPKQ